MGNIQKSIEVDRPLSTVYNQWTQFEEFPEFMEGVQEVIQLDDRRLHWVADIAGRRAEWDAEITEQVPDRRISWRSTSGAPNSGTVSFETAGSDRTRVTLSLDYESGGVMENMAEAMGLVERRVVSDLKRFKEFIESRAIETGAWRGEVRGGQLESTSAMGQGRGQDLGASSPSTAALRAKKSPGRGKSTKGSTTRSTSGRASKQTRAGRGSSARSRAAK